MWIFMGMKDYIIRRAIQSVILFFVALVVNFFIFHLVPGDPATYLLPPGTDSETRRILREQFGLDEPLSVQFVKYLKMIASGRIGHSFVFNRPVGKVIIGDSFVDSRLLNTLILMGSSAILAIIMGTLLGLTAAWKRGSKFDYAVSVSSLVIYSLPIFFVGLLVILVFGIHLHWIPITGSHTPFIEQTRGEFIVDYLRHLIAPMLVITLFMLTETVFSWPGIGRMTYEAILAPDYPLLEGMFLIIAAVVIVANFIADILYSVLDPRIRY